MKKRHRRPMRTSSRSRPKPTRNAIEAMAFAGQSEDAIALYYGLHKNTLRARYADALDRGRDRARDAAADAETITKEEYWFLNAASSSMSDPDWFDPEHGSLLFPGTNGEGARSISDAYAYWKNSNGKFITTGLFGEFDPEKYAAFAKIVADYRQKLKLQPDDAPLPGRARAGKF